MPIDSLISLNVILCEKILKEEDQVYSAIRIADIFLFKRTQSDRNLGEPIPLHVLVVGKTKPEDKSEHTAQLHLVLPDGEQRPMGEPLRAVFEALSTNQDQLAPGSNISDVAGGFTMEGRFTLLPRQVGRHQIVVYLDGVLVARTPFTILELKGDAVD